MADLARRSGRARSTVTRACQGELRAALVNDRVNAAHPRVIAWARARGIDPAALTPGVFVRRDVVAELSPEAFARFAGVTSDEIFEARRGSLRAAMLPSGNIDLAHAAALEFLARRPFRRGANGSIDETDVPDGILAAACSGGDEIEIDHPCTRAFFARCMARVLSNAELDEIMASARSE
jgi:hypothetical protein